MRASRELIWGQKGYLKIKYPPYVDFLKLGKGYQKIKYPPMGLNNLYI
jgi:hypothetical protein